jgi:Tfp pilus assembly protein FimT
MLHWFVHKRSRGFTQIELAVIVVVIGVLAANAAPNLSKWYHQKQVDTALEKIDTALQEAQNEAVKKHQSCSIALSEGKNTSIEGNCLLSKRTLKDVELNQNASHNPWTITFDANGENRDPNKEGTLWLSAIDGDVREKCLTISVGIGLRRSGTYNGSKCITP